MSRAERSQEFFRAKRNGEYRRPSKGVASAAKHVEPNYDAEMKLPAGKTCGDCANCRHCTGMYGIKPTDTSCDFWPGRYRERAPSARGMGI